MIFEIVPVVLLLAAGQVTCQERLWERVNTTAVITATHLPARQAHFPEDTQLQSPPGESDEGGGQRAVRIQNEEVFQKATSKMQLDCVCVAERSCPTSRVMSLNEAEELAASRAQDITSETAKMFPPPPQTSLTCSPGMVCCKPLSWYIAAHERAIQTANKQMSDIRQRRVEMRNPFYEVYQPLQRQAKSEDLASAFSTEAISAIQQSVGQEGVTNGIEYSAGASPTSVGHVPLPEARKGGALERTPQVYPHYASQQQNPYIEERQDRLIDSVGIGIDEGVRRQQPSTKIFSPQVIVRTPAPPSLEQLRDRYDPSPPTTEFRDHTQQREDILPPAPPLDLRNSGHEGWQVRVIERIYDHHHAHCNRRSFTRFLCSGAIISSSWVLVPGHCYKSLTQDRLANVFVLIRADRRQGRTGPGTGTKGGLPGHVPGVGQPNLQSADPGTSSLNRDENEDLNDGTYMEVPIATTYFYSMRDTLENDIALVRLSQEVRHVRPIELLSFNSSSPGYIRRMRCIATGWGRNEYGGRYSTELQQSRYSLLNGDMCEAILRRRALCPQDGLHETMLCMGHDYSRRGGENVCHTFGCGLYTCQEPDSGVWKLAGLTAAMFSCDLGMVPTLLTNVAYHREWIEAVIAGRLEPGRYMDIDDGLSRDSQYQTSKRYGNTQIGGTFTPPVAIGRRNGLTQQVTQVTQVTSVRNSGVKEHIGGYGQQGSDLRPGSGLSGITSQERRETALALEEGSSGQPLAVHEDDSSSVEEEAGFEKKKRK